MVKVAYFDCPTGLAGDMCLGALVDAGVPLDYIDQQLQSLGLHDEYELIAESVKPNGQRATQVRVELVKFQTPNHVEGVKNSEHVEDIAFEPHHHHHESEHRHVGSEHLSGSNHLSSQVLAHDHARGDRHLPEIKQMIRMSTLPSRVKQWSIDIFTTLAKAEGAVHGISPNEVHFHEVGATDAIVDVVGTCLGLDWLDIQQIYCSALPTGGGTVWAAHGRLPVPAPAVLKLFELGQVPIYSNGIERELVTPTGAAIATTLATQFGRPPAMTLQRVGLGAGTLELPIPNMVRLWIGEMGKGAIASHSHASQNVTSDAYSGIDAAQGRKLISVQQENSHAYHSEVDVAAPVETTVAVLETQIDDLSPQVIGYLFQVLFDAGALDVFTQSVGMKKCRPGVLLTVICKPEHVRACETVIFRETTTLGIRRRLDTRTELHREFHSVRTSYGTVRLKIGRADPQAPVLNVQPEYEDCVQLAQEAGVSWLQVHQMAIALFTIQQNAHH